MIDAVDKAAMADGTLLEALVQLGDVAAHIEDGKLVLAMAPHSAVVLRVAP